MILMSYKENRLAVNEVEINIKRIIEECIRNIKWVIISAVLFAILLSMGKYAIELDSYNKGLSGDQSTELTSMDLLVVDTYGVLENRVKQLEEYQACSYLYQLDFSDIYQGKIQLYIEADSEIKADIAGAIVDYINSTTIGNSLHMKDSKLDARYAYELVSAEIASFDEHVNRALIDVTIYAGNETECKLFMGYIIDILSVYSKNLQESIGSHNLNVISESYINGYVESIYVQQKTILNDKQIAITEFESFNNALTETQKVAIYEKFFANGEEFTSSEILPKPSISVKFMILGAAIGGILMIAIVIIRVLFGGRIQTDKEINKRVELNHIGTVKAIPLTKSDKLVNLLMSRDKNVDSTTQIERLAIHIQQICAVDQIESIKIIGTTEWLKLDVVQALQQVLREAGVQSQIVGNILDNSDNLSKLDNGSKVIIAEKINESKVADLYEEYKLCANINVKVLGYFAVNP